MTPQFKNASEVIAEIKRLINVRIKLSDNKIYKKSGKRFIKVDEKLGALFCQKSNQISRLSFISDVQSGGSNSGIIYLN